MACCGRTPDGSVSVVFRDGRRTFLACALAASFACAVPSTSARAQAEAGSSRADSDRWFVGAYYRHTWVPKFVLEPFFERAAGILNEGFGLSARLARRSGATPQFGIGFNPYDFRGAFNARDASVESTEYVTSTLGLWHVSASVLWPIQMHRTLTLEIGLGVDLGILTGNVRRSEAYPADDAFRPCKAALDPATKSKNRDAAGERIAYCEQPFDRNGKPIDTDRANVSGAQYDVKETRVPPVMLVPMLPHLALRFVPIRRVSISVEAAFGIAQFWIGTSIHAGLGSMSEPAAVQSRRRQPEPPAPLPRGRIVGKLMEQGSNAPIGRASVKSKRVFSAIQTDDAGLFVFDSLEPGTVQLEITHPSYEAGSCQSVIPAQGGDVFLHCFLQPEPSGGAISGQVNDEQGAPIAGASVEVTGPAVTRTQTDAEGLFAVLEAAEGTYRLRVQAEGFLTQLVEVEVVRRETAIPHIILLRPAQAP